MNRLLALVTVLAALALAGCGSTVTVVTDGTGTPATPLPTPRSVKHHPRTVPVAAATIPQPSATTPSAPPTCPNGIVVVAISCALGNQVGAAYANQNLSEQSPSTLSAGGLTFHCTQGDNASIFNATCIASAGTVMFEDTTGGPQAPLQPSAPNPVLNAQCAALYAQWQADGEQNDIAIHEYSQLRCN